MDAGRFEWDDANTDHIDAHHVEPEEAEEAMVDPDRVRVPAHRGRTGERRRAVIGATEAGRVLFVAYTVRGIRFRVVTARDATEGERRVYFS